MLVFLDRHVAAGTLSFLDQINLIAHQFMHTLGGLFGRQNIARRVDHAGLRLVIPAAGVGATALIRVAVIKVARQQAAPRVGDAQRAMDEDFDFSIRALLADLRHLIKRQLARQDDPADTDTFPEANRCRVDGIGLHREVDFHLGPGLAHQHDEAGIGHDQRVGLQGDHRCHVLHVVLHLVVMREDVGHQIKPVAQLMRQLNPLLQHLCRAEVVVAHTQRVAWLAGINGGRAKGKSSLQHLQ